MLRQRFRFSIDLILVRELTLYTLLRSTPYIVIPVVGLSCWKFTKDGARDNSTLRYECDETFSDECEFAAWAEGEWCNHTCQENVCSHEYRTKFYITRCEKADFRTRGVRKTAFTHSEWYKEIICWSRPVTLYRSLDWASAHVPSLWNPCSSLVTRARYARTVFCNSVRLLVEGLS